MNKKLVKRKSQALGPAADLSELADQARFFVEAGLAKATRVAYAGHWSRFLTWTAENDLDSTPGGEGIVSIVALYITHLAKEGKKVSTIDQALAAVSLAHTSQGLESPTKKFKIRKLMRGIKNEVGVAPDKKTALRLSDLKKMSNACLPTFRGKRDRTILLIGFLGAFRRAELVAIRYEDIKPIKGGLRIHIPRSKTDQQGKGRYVTIPAGKNAAFCPVRALTAWLTASRIIKGPIFRRVFTDGTVGTEQVSRRVVTMVVKKYAKEIGLDAALYSGHSLRSGFVTAAANNGAKDWEIMKTTGHKNVQTLHGYIQTSNLEGNPAKDFDL